ncbi:MAG TPA: branched-chain amino acid ABC transporter permease [Chloroflexota bacterium]|nr:branched-chain amino acid ABC transporter permease [Chloroflexota bacterium]
MDTLALAGLDSLSLAMLLFLLSAGLSITFGLMRVLNMAHASFYLLGGYIGLAVFGRTRNFWISVVAAGLAMALAGCFLYRGFLQRFSKEDEMPQVLLTFGMLLIAGDAALVTWGGAVLRLPPPTSLSGPIALGSVVYPRYRFFVIVAGLLMAVVLSVLVNRTRLGAVVRAGVDDTETAQTIGVNMPRVFLLVFALGSLIAGLAGALGAPYLGIYPGLDFDALLLAFAVVIVGGAGSVEGAFVAAIVVALLDTLTKTYVPALSYFSIYVPMALILAFRPQGLLGRTAA